MSSEGYSRIIHLMATLEFHDPSGAIEVKQPFAPRVSALAGRRVGFVSNDQWQAFRMLPLLIDLCINNRRHGHKNAGSSEAVIKDRRSAGRFRAFLVIRHSAAMSSSRLSGRPLASVALKWVQTNSSGFRSGA